MKLSASNAISLLPLPLPTATQHIPIEAKKAKPGSHASGRAVDIAVRGDKAVKLIKVAFEFGITGIGVQQKGGGRFIHLDDLKLEDGFARPNIWSY